MNESGAGRRTLSGIPIAALYSLEGLAAGGFDPARELGLPGEFPFTRGAYPTMHRGRLWTRRQIAGFGTAQATNQRYRFLLAHGQTGLSTDFDHPTLTGYDSDHELAEGEVGRLGVDIDTAADMGELFDGIPLEQASVSLTINHPAIVLLAMFLHAAERRLVSPQPLFTEGAMRRRLPPAVRSRLRPSAPPAARPAPAPPPPAASR